MCQFVLQYLPSTLSSNAEIHFNSSIDLSDCALFGDLDFTTSDSSSWANITRMCISGTAGFVILLRQTVAGSGHPLSAAQCQYYTLPGDQGPCLCRMDCLLTFQFENSNPVKFGYIHLRNISCNQDLFRDNINDLFNNENNIHPSFTSRSSGCSLRCTYNYIIVAHSENKLVVLTMCLLPELHNYTHSYYQELLGS